MTDPQKYKDYLKNHRECVSKGINWLHNHNIMPSNIYNKLIERTHDQSKDDLDEFIPYNEYFYGENSNSASVLQEFNKAWLLHIHRNPHHWQHWVLIKDDGTFFEPTLKDSGILSKLEAIKMPEEYVYEMICDWWAFSWDKGDLREIFSWYCEHRPGIMLHCETRPLVDYILCKMKEELNKDGVE